MDILIKPIVTEKMTPMADKYNRYGFMVHRDANKIQIKSAVEELYNVTVENVNTINVLGKSISRYTRRGIQAGRKPSYKKAYVTLVQGDKIDFYSNI